MYQIELYWAVATCILILNVHISSNCTHVWCSLSDRGLQCVHITPLFKVSCWNLIKM